MNKKEELAIPLSVDEMIKDYKIAYQSRLASVLGRKEVLSGKAKFGIFGDGKEVVQVAMAHSFKKGDWRSGYYRDQTLMFALGLSNIRQFFAQLYADSDPRHDPASAGRQMNSHFATRYIDENGQWLNQTEQYNSSADISPTAGQMARALGLAYASKLFRTLSDLAQLKAFSKQGQEVCFGTIGDASTSEGIFWEVMNAAAVLQVPLIMTVYDDGYGISVPKKYQTVKESISKALAGFAPESPYEHSCLDIYTVEGWNYPKLISCYQKAVDKTRETHRPCLIHVYDLTQPQGHSTSGSHERYKDAERMQFEKEMDALTHMRAWLLHEHIVDASQLDEWEQQWEAEVKSARDVAWNQLQNPLREKLAELLNILEHLQTESQYHHEINAIMVELKRLPVLFKRSIAQKAFQALQITKEESLASRESLSKFYLAFEQNNHHDYDHFLYNESPTSALKIKGVPPKYSNHSEVLDGSQVIRRCFDRLLTVDPRIFIIGEDVGHLGGVNTEFEGLQEKHGFWRVTDTGIREASILGQGIGAAMRGLRPVVDIQYLDYLLYCLQPMSDDLATLLYRSAGQQIAPVIVRTKGHRLEGIWHTGSPMGMILNAIRGMHFCVPRNMVQAAGMYNTLFESDDPALVVEVLNGYRLKETLPDNLADFRVELGVPEILRSGQDITLVTYGACVRIAQQACNSLAELGIDTELIDIQTLLPFDRFSIIAQSVQKTNALLVVDEDVKGGASAFILEQILERDGAYDYLDAPPQTLTAKDHRSAYGSDGDYYSKPNAEQIIIQVYKMLQEREPERFPDPIF